MTEGGIKTATVSFDEALTIETSEEAARMLEAIESAEASEPLPEKDSDFPNMKLIKEIYHL